MLPRKASSLVGTAPVPQTNSGGRVENTKAIERTVVKELGKIPPLLREKEDVGRVKVRAPRARWGRRDQGKATVY